MGLTSDKGEINNISQSVRLVKQFLIDKLVDGGFDSSDLKMSVSKSPSGQRAMKDWQLPVAELQEERGCMCVLNTGDGDLEREEATVSKICADKDF